MTVQTAAVLKEYFETGDKPTQGQFGDLIDTVILGKPLNAGTTTGNTNEFNMTVDSDLAALAAGQIFTALAGQTNTGASVSSINGISAVGIKKNGATDLSAGDILQNAALEFYFDGTNLQLLNPFSATSGGGGVSSVALTLPNVFTVTGSPVTTSGTLAASFASQTQNQVLASPNGVSGTPTFRNAVGADFGSQSANVVLVGPTGGGAASPTFRALTAADLPSTSVPQLNLQTFTASGTFTTSSSITTNTVFRFIITGGGAGGVQNSDNGGGSGGGAGATAIWSITGLSPSTGYAVVVGSGGSVGSNGGDSSVTVGGTTVTGGLGLAPLSTATFSAGGLGGTATNGTINISGGPGGSGFSLSSTWMGGKGGDSFWGGGAYGPSGTTNKAGVAGLAYGTGGSGGIGIGAGSVGKAGIVLVEWVG